MSWRFYESAPRKRFVATAGAVEEPVETHAAQPHYGEFLEFEPVEDGYWVQDLHASTLDVTPAFFPPAAPVDQPVDEIGNRWFVVSTINVSETGARAPPGYVDETGRRVFLTSPEAVVSITDAELQAASQTHEQPQHEEEQPNYDALQDGAVDAFLAGPPAAVEPDTTFAAQPHYGDIQIDGEEHVDTPLLEGIEGYLSPNDAFDVTIATQPLAEQPWFDEQDIDSELDNESTLENVAPFFPPDVTAEFFTDQLDEQPWFSDQEIDTELANESTLEVAAQLFPPDVTEPFFGQYPLAEQPWFPDTETENYDDGSTLDVSWSMDFASGAEVTIATEPLSEQPWYPEAETEDYANDSTLDVTPAFFPPPLSDDSYIAALDLGQDPDDTEPDWEFSPFLDQLEGYLSPNDAFDTTIATQPLAEQPWFPEQDIDTELENENALENVAQLFPPDVTTDFLATQPLAEFPEFPDDLSQYDTGYVEQNEAYVAGPPTFAPDAEALAATQVFEQDIANQYPDPDPTNDQPLVDGAVEAFQSPNDAFDVTIAAQFLPEMPEDVPELAQDALTDDPAPFLSLVSDDGYIASLDLPQYPQEEEPWFAPEIRLGDGVTAFLAGDDGFIAAQDLPDQWADALDETPEQTPTPLDVAWIDTLALTDAMVAAVHHLAVEVDAHFIPDPEIDSNLSTLDTTAVFFPPAPPSGTGPDVFRAILRPRWRADVSLRWATSSTKERWNVRVQSRWKAIIRSRFR